MTHNLTQQDPTLGFSIAELAKQTQLKKCDLYYQTTEKTGGYHRNETLSYFRCVLINVCILIGSSVGRKDRKRSMKLLTNQRHIVMGDGIVKFVNSAKQVLVTASKKELDRYASQIWDFTVALNLPGMTLVILALLFEKHKPFFYSELKKLNNQNKPNKIGTFRTNLLAIERKFVRIVGPKKSSTIITGAIHTRLNDKYPIMPDRGCIGNALGKKTKLT